MRILLTNDDGYMAPGLAALYHGLKDIAEVTVVAPDREQSAVGMKITLTDPLRLKEFELHGMKGLQLNGTPADCVKVGCSELVGSKPDFVFSGINHGSNVGMNCIYSGTVAGAIEGAMLGIPSVAMSLTAFDSLDFEGSVMVARKVLKKLQNETLGKYELLSVNVPPLRPEQIKGIKIARVSHSVFREVFDKRIDSRQREYFWMGGIMMDFGAQDDGDDILTQDGWATVTPLNVDITAERTLERMRGNGWNEDWQKG